MRIFTFKEFPEIINMEFPKIIHMAGKGDGIVYIPLCILPLMFKFSDDIQENPVIVVRH